MKATCIAFLLLAGIAQASEVTLAWDHTDEATCTYVLETGADADTFTDTVAVDGLQHTLTNVPNNVWRYSRVKAVHPVGGESDYSETLKWAAKVKPDAPTGLRKILQKIISWFRGRRGLRQV